MLPLLLPAIAPLLLLAIAPPLFHALFGAVLVPPLIVAILDPDIFHDALDYAGTFGISILFGAIPAVMALRMRWVVRLRCRRPVLPSQCAPLPIAPHSIRRWYIVRPIPVLR
jgi:hypothetical protein